MLGKRYTMANDNISAFAVEKVQILERHQPIKMLDGVTDSEQAAFNLKLKKNFTKTGQFNLALGASPFLWDTKLSPMIFTKKWQGMFLGQSNNVAKNLNQYDFNQHLEGNFNGNGISAHRWTNNVSSFFSGNILQKLKNDWEIKVGSAVNFNKEKFEKNIYSQIKTLDNEIELFEDFNSKLNQKRYSGNVILEKNAKTFFLNNTAQFSLYRKDNLERIELNKETHQQDFDSKNQELSNRFKILFPLNDNLLGISSNVEIWNKKSPTLIIPGVFEDLISENINYDKLFQLRKMSGLSFNNQLNYTFKYKKWSLDAILAHEFTGQKQESEIQWFLNETVQVLGSDFRNQQDIRNSDLFFKTNFEIRFKDILLKIKPQISNLSYSVEDYLQNKRITNSKISFEPDISLNKKIGSLLDLTLSGKRQDRFGAISNINTGYLLEDYRRINRFGQSLIDNYSGVSSQARIDFKEVFSGIFAHLVFQHSSTKSNLVSSELVNSDGQIIQNTNSENNNRENLSISGELGKYFSKVKTTVSLSPIWSNTSNFTYINNTLAKINNRNLAARLRWNSNVKNTLIIEGKHSFSKNESDFLNSTFENYLWRQDLKVSTHFLERHALELQIDLNSIKNQQQWLHNYFLDATYKQTLKNKWRLKLDVYNILNQNQYFARNFTLNTLTETQFSLRPRQFLVGLEMGFR